MATGRCDKNNRVNSTVNYDVHYLDQGQMNVER